MIGRKNEQERIRKLLESTRSEFLAVTGRRRVGKTYLIDSLLKGNYCFTMTGIQGGNMESQLVNFDIKLAEFNDSYAPKKSTGWQEAFQQLKIYLKTLDKQSKQVIFLDELPWMATPKSGFIQMLAHLWNDYLSKESHFILVICGSASSWISQKIINDPGGLHNRVTENIHLYPFTIAETNEFLQKQGLQFSIQEVAKIYMTLGGIPFYLEHIRKGETFATAIEKLCFAPIGILYNEYNNLFQALFSNAEMHQQIIAALATRQNGMTHADILVQIGMQQPNGSYKRALDELIISDFVLESSPFGKKKRGATYRLIDEFSIFYHRFMESNRKYTPGIWQQLAESQSYKIWAGYAFETLCHIHIKSIKKALGIPAVYTEINSLSVPASAGQEGFQIDLLIDRKDNAINLCEIKFHNGPFAINKTIYEKLVALRQQFIDFSGTKKQVFLTLISNHGVVPNAYAKEIVDAEVKLEELV